MLLAVLPTLQGAGSKQQAGSSGGGRITDEIIDDDAAHSALVDEIEQLKADRLQGKAVPPQRMREVLNKAMGMAVVQATGGLAAGVEGGGGLLGGWRDPG